MSGDAREMTAHALEMGSYTHEVRGRTRMEYAIHTVELLRPTEPHERYSGLCACSTSFMLARSLWPTPLPVDFSRVPSSLACTRYPRIIGEQ